MIRQGATEADRSQIVSIAPTTTSFHNNSHIPDIGGVVALSPGEEGGAHDGLGVVGRDLPQAVVRLQAALGQLQVQVSPTGVHLQHLDIVRLEG